MASVQEMKATVRPKGGKGAARTARRSGRVPGVIYGNNEPPMMVLIEHDELKKRIYQGRFLTTLYELDVDGKKHRVIPRDFQLDALKDLPMHVDFLRVAAGRQDPRQHRGARAQHRPVARREARRFGERRQPQRRAGVPGRRHSGVDRRRHRRPRDQPLQAPQRGGAAAGRARDRPRGHDAGDHRGRRRATRKSRRPPPRRRRGRCRAAAARRCAGAGWRCRACCRCVLAPAAEKK